MPREKCLFKILISYLLQKVKISLIILNNHTKFHFKNALENVVINFTHNFAPLSFFLIYFVFFILTKACLLYVLVLHPLSFSSRGGRTQGLSYECKIVRDVLQIGCTSYYLTTWSYGLVVHGPMA